MSQTAINRIRRYWGPMVESSAPTLWEAAIHQQGKKAFWNAGSLCHGFGAAPIGVLQTTVLGVRPTEPGFKVFSFAPKACGLGFAAGSIPTPSGEIRVEWHMDASLLWARIEIPDGLLAVTPDGKKYEAGKHQISFQ